LGAPSSALLTLLGSVRATLRLGPQFLIDLRQAYRRGKQAKNLMPVYWEEHFAESVESLRAALDCPLA
jgi:ubiquinone biosynthesis protein Coq4